jgi:wobble nucleotide-excising tRNase
MITKIDIEKFGLFDNYKWDNEIGKQETFRRVNIIYGRNYSGKTTLSRILKCLEDKRIHDNYTNANFNIAFSNDKSVTHTNLSEGLNDYNIRVYNSDFVKENLSWLHNDDGTIKPFTILGAKNVEIESKIKAIDEQLGSTEEEKGLLFQQLQLEQTYKSKKQLFEKKGNEFDISLSDKAKSIKNNATIFNVPTYRIDTIKKDIPNAIKQGELSTEVITEKQKLLKEDAKNSINPLLEFKPQFDNYYTHVNELLKKKIKPSKPIAELLNDSLLQAWVRQGIDRHRGVRETCGFCGGPIDKSLWDKLDAHFSKESEDLRNETKNKIDQLEQAKINLDAFFSLTKEQFYSNLIPQFEAFQKQWITTIKTYSQSIDSLISELKEREKDIFKERELANIPDVSQTILETIQEVNKLIDEQNKKTETLSKDQEKARIELRYSEIAKFLTTINYNTKITEIETLKKESDNAKTAFDTLNSQIETLNEGKGTLEAQSKDESKGAELVNQHLQHFFGHNELKLVAEGKSPNIRFKISRDGCDASNLSEGECSLISFCYFIARMEDELKDELNSKKLIIYIDDPISSLDSNHIFFMFSLIESIIAKPKKYCQLFISTHNLDFLKYLKQLTFPKYKPAENAKEKRDVKHFLIERKSKSKIILKLAPDYLKNYITEFNYLFSQIYNCSESENQKISEDYQYNFGNNMRKFLEAYLFYKYPSDKLSFDERIRKFFNDDVSYNLVRRVVNEYSHLEGSFDRALVPIDIEAIKQVSQAVMNKIKTQDEEQYNALIDSVKNEVEI